MRGKKERTARIVGADYTDEGSLKHTNTLKMVDRDAQGGVNVAFGGRVSTRKTAPTTRARGVR